MATIEIPGLQRIQVCHRNSSMGSGAHLVLIDLHTHIWASDMAMECRSRGEKDLGTAAMEVQSRVGNVVEDPRNLPPVMLMDED